MRLNNCYLGSQARSLEIRNPRVLQAEFIVTTEASPRSRRKTFNEVLFPDLPGKSLSEELAFVHAFPAYLTDRQEEDEGRYT